MTNTINNAEQALYLCLLQLSKYHPIANEWLARLPHWLADIKDKSRYAHAPAYQSAVDRLPELSEAMGDIDGTDGSKKIPTNNPSVSLDADAITIRAELSDSQARQATALLKQLMPWRKGPFQIGVGDNAIHIDTEWHSDYKWQRIAPHLSDLRNRRILDVGGGSGYHGWRMAGAGAKSVIIIDPSCLFYHQFMAIRHFIAEGDADSQLNPHASCASDSYRVHYIPVGLEALPEQSELFDTVFSMGVLYHRPSPFEHLQLLKGQLVKGGELVLETLVIEGDANTVLVPHDRYAQMNNVYFIPSVQALMAWLKKAGFSEVRCVDVDVTTTAEQRATEWMTYHSLADFLDPTDSSITIEGYPAPKRATVIAKK